MIPAEQEENSKYEHLKPWQFKPGQSGNPSGRPKGPSMKEWAKVYLASLNDEERLEFLKGMDKADIWKLAEGNPANNTDITTKGDKIVFMPSEVISQLNESTPKAEGGSNLDQKI